MMNPLLSINNLTVGVGDKVIVDNVSFDVPQGKIVAIAGASGSGKTTIGLSILRLIPPSLHIQQGKIVFEGQELLELSSERMRQCRGARIGMVFQEPLSAFDPLFTVGQQLDDVLVAHTKLSKQERYKKTLDALTEVELPDPQRAYKSFPHQLSGGMRQRAMVAQAMVCGPSLIIADEPTSSLDVLLQVKIMELFVRLKKKNISILLISHDLEMISHLADETIVLRQSLEAFQ
jgi:ABC-type glutathione transport system ATPase component